MRGEDDLPAHAGALRIEICTELPFADIAFREGGGCPRRQGRAVNSAGLVWGMAPGFRAKKGPLNKREFDTVDCGRAWTEGEECEGAKGNCLPERAVAAD